MKWTYIILTWCKGWFLVTFLRGTKGTDSKLSRTHRGVQRCEAFGWGGVVMGMEWTPNIFFSISAIMFSNLYWQSIHRYIYVDLKVWRWSFVRFFAKWISKYQKVIWISSNTRPNNDIYNFVKKSSLEAIQENISIQNTSHMQKTKSIFIV